LQIAGAPRKTSVGTARQNRISEAVYETAKGLYASGAIDRTTMREFDALCLPAVPRYTARQIKALRARCNCSQAVFAKYMNVSPSSLQQWEVGTKKPAGIACKLLNLIERKGLEALA
jgi:putative transcriptional regulator